MPTRKWGSEELVNTTTAGRQWFSDVNICKARISVRTHGASGPDYSVRLDLPQKR